MSNSSPFIFISYAHSDIDKVQPIINTLTANNFNVWYDKGIEAGTEWPEFIAEKIIESSVIVAFISKSSLESHNCRREINFAIELKKELLVVHLEDVNLTPGMRMQLNTLQAMFYNRSSNAEEFSNEICNAKILQSCRKEEPVVPAEPKAEIPVEPVIPVAEKPITPVIPEEKPVVQPDVAHSDTTIPDINYHKYLTDSEKDTIVLDAIAYLREKHVADSKNYRKIFLQNELNSKQEKNATTYITNNAVVLNEILGLQDSSLGNNGKDGTIITNNYLYIKSLKKISIINFFDVKSVTADENYYLNIEYFNEPSEKSYVYNTVMFKDFIEYIINYDYSNFNLLQRHEKAVASSDAGKQTAEFVLTALKYAKDESAFDHIFTFTTPQKAQRKQIENAIAKYASNIAFEDVIFIYDDTISANGKSGFLVTKDTICFSNKSNGQIPFFYIESVGKNDNDIVVNFKDGSSKSLFAVSCDKLLYHFFKYIIENK